MLDAFIIEDLKRRERERHENEVQQRPRVSVPGHDPKDNRPEQPEDADPSSQRGPVVWEL